MFSKCGLHWGQKDLGAYLPKRPPSPSVDILSPNVWKGGPGFCLSPIPLRRLMKSLPPRIWYLGKKKWVACSSVPIHSPHSVTLTTEVPVPHWTETSTGTHPFIPLTNAAVHTGKFGTWEEEARGVWYIELTLSEKLSFWLITSCLRQNFEERLFRQTCLKCP